MFAYKPVPKLALSFLATLIGVLCFGVPAAVQAQTEDPASRPAQPSAYWQYDAPGPLGKVVVADVDQNGIDDFLAITDSDQVVLLNANGGVRWTYQTPGNEPLVQLTALNVDGASDETLEVLLATEDELYLLASDGELLWRTPLDFPPIPTVLLTGALDDDQQGPMNNQPLALTGFDYDGDQNEELLVLLQSGIVQLYDELGQLIWDYPESPPASEEPLPQIAIGDLDRDGRQEIVFSYFIRYTRVFVLDSDGQRRWERSISGRPTALELVAWDDDSPMDIAIGTSLGENHRRVTIIDASNVARWFRTPNKTVTDLQTAQLSQGRVLLVGTNTGSLIAYDREGRPTWRYLPPNANRSIVSISSHSSNTTQEGQPAVAFTLAPVNEESNEAGIVVLLDEGGRELQRFPAAAASGQTRLVDVNGDQINELMLASFGTLSLTDPGTGARKNAQAWDYRLFAAPLSTLVADLNNDGEDELLVGTRDGQLHILESSNGQAGAIVNTGGQLSHLALLGASDPEDDPLVVAAHNHAADATTATPVVGYLELIQPSGRAVWTEPVALTGGISSLATGNVNRDTAAEIIVGTSDGKLVVLSSGGRELWRASVRGIVEKLTLVDGNDDGQQEIIVLSDRNQIMRFDGTDTGQTLANFNLHQVLQLAPLPVAAANELSLLLATDDGLLRILTQDGEQPWHWTLPSGQVSVLTVAGDSLLVATNEGVVFNIDVVESEPLWQLQNLEQVSALYWGDLDGGGANDLAIGTRTGQIFLHTSDARQWDSVNLSSNSSVFALTGLRRGPDQEAQLAVITDNGVVQLYEAKPNRPPLLIDPRVEVSSSRYDVRVTVVEEDGDEVAVLLQTYESASGQWVDVEQRSAVGRDTLLFPIAPDESGGLNYRFVFDDGTHEGIITPPVGPPAPALRPLRSAFIFPALVLMGVLVIALLIRHLLSIDSQAQRFYRRLQQQPTRSLALLNEQYQLLEGSPDFLLRLANRARPDRNLPLINLIDGFFLLDGRPGAAIAILDSALKEATDLSPSWDHIRAWQSTIALTRDLMEAPSVTELSLLRPQLAHLLQRFGSAPPAQSLEPFLPVLNNLRDSERVDLAEDRIVYLHEALVLLRQIRDTSGDRAISIGRRIQESLQERLSGLVNADIELLRGQAQLFITLKTKRVVPEGGQVLLALEVQNKGRSAARNVTITLERDVAYQIDSLPEKVSLLSPGRTAVVDFRLKPGVEDRFRAVFSITYDDRSQEQRHMQFADMVSLLPPQRDFRPIPNPYLPGTPLRGDSPLFYGREELFEFILENAGQIARRNVLILVGQRRTGKTSALLRLDRHLPPNLLPVYIDCQSLGVLPGMPALFHDLAWHIADVLAIRGHDVEVPAAPRWRDDPARLFRHEFLPAVRQQLPPETNLLLVFDEFEAFENLVNDGILPSTLFTYMRHLMQHSDGLSFAFVGTRRLEEMTSDYWSVLFNIALYRQIGFLSLEETTRLVTEPVAPHIIYDDLALDKIWRVTAGHPYFLQLVCYTLVKRANAQMTGYVTISDVNAALEEMLRLGEVHFAYLWQRSTYTERALLTAVAHLMDRDMPFHAADLIQYLEQYGFRFDPAEVTTGLNHLVEREIMREITDEGTTYYELKIGLVGLWAAQNKSLSKLYESKNGAHDVEPMRAGVEHA